MNRFDSAFSASSAVRLPCSAASRPAGTTGRRQQHRHRPRPQESADPAEGLPTCGGLADYANELLRLAFPRRVYTQSHLDYLAEVLILVKQLAPRIRGVKIVEEPPVLRHFSSRFEPVAGHLVAD